MFMAVKRSRKTSKKVSNAYEQAMGAEGAPVALDLLGFGSTIGDLIRGKSPKPPRSRARRRNRGQAEGQDQEQDGRAKKKTAARKSRRRK